MLTIYNTDGVASYPLLLERKKWYITHEYDGQDKLTFDLSPKHQYYQYIGEEIRVSAQGNRYKITSIDECDTVSTVSCIIDLDDWKEGLYKEYRRTNITLAEVLEEIKPAGWAILNADITTKRTTVEASDGKGLELATPFDILGKLEDVYSVVFNYNTIDRKLLVIDPNSYQPSGEYIMDKLNLSGMKYLGDSSDFATRLYPYGKDGLTISSVNNGQEYIENHQYSGDVISIGWKDERYTDPSSLLAAAQDKLAAASYPVRSYECTVKDLAKLDDRYTLLSFAMYRIVILIDPRRGTKVNHRIVQYKEYPEAPEQNVVSLSTTMPKVQSNIQQLSGAVQQIEQQVGAAIGGSYTADQIDQKLASLSSSVEQQFEDERETSDERYQGKMTSISDTVSVESETEISLPGYTDYLVSLTPLGEGNCWAEKEEAKLIIHTSAPMDVQYLVLEVQNDPVQP